VTDDFQSDSDPVESESDLVEPESDLVEPESDSESEPEPESMATVRLRWRDGRGASVTADDEPVLDAAEESGLSLPFGCRTGACGTCTGRLLDGEVVHERPPRALKPHHLDDGYVLTCIAVPTGDCTVEVGTDVHHDLLVNPWR